MMSKGEIYDMSVLTSIVMFIIVITLSFVVFGRNKHQKVIDYIIPFCEKRTDITPFIAKYDLISIDD